LFVGCGKKDDKSAIENFHIKSDKFNYDIISDEKSELTVGFNENAEHVVRFIKLSENANGTLRITGVKADGKIEPTAAKEKKIEFIGDSITCGYGVDGTDGSFSTITEDGSKTYAYKVAQKFDADFSLFAFSGFGIISGYTTDGERNTASTVPQYYDKLGFSYYCQFGSDNTQMKDVDYDFDQFDPDLVVINLGTNDNSYLNSVSSEEKKASEKEDFTAEYAKFITAIRAAHPDAEILCTLGIMGQELYPEIEKAVEQYKEETGDEKVNAFKFNVQDIANNGKGIDWHPAPQSHIDAAHELIEEIETLYGWTADPEVDIDVNPEVTTPTTGASSTATVEPVEETIATSTKAIPADLNTTTKVPPSTFITSKVPPKKTYSAKNPPPSNSTTKRPPSDFKTAAPVEAITTEIETDIEVETATAPIDDDLDLDIETVTEIEIATTEVTIHTSAKTTPILSTKVVKTTPVAKTIPVDAITITTAATKTITKTVPVDALTITTPAKSVAKTVPVEAITVTVTTPAKNVPKTTKTVPVDALTITTPAKSVPKTTKTVPVDALTVTAKTKTIASKTIPVVTAEATETAAVAEPEPEQEPTVEPVAEPEPEPTAEPVAEPEPEPTTAPVDEKPVSSEDGEYFSCEKDDYACKNKMAQKCYEELTACWNKPYTDSLGDECNSVNQKCSKIFE